jgi:hypothetical protein
MADPKNEEHKEFVQKLYKHEPNTLWTMSALNSVIQHWVEAEVLIKRAANEQVDLYGPKWSPNGNDEDSMGEYFAERDLAREFQDRTMIPLHRFSCIVMLCATVERELKRLVEHLEKKHGEQKLKVSDLRNTSYLERVNTFLNAFFGLRLSDCPQYAAMADLQKIRTCIVHYQGEAGLMGSNEKRYLIDLTAKRKGFRAYEHPNIDIDIEAECIQQFATESWEFFVWIFKTLQWKIDTHYQGNYLERHFKLIRSEE